MERHLHNNPAISVVMAVYNGEAYLKEAIDSILGQTFTDFEYIIVDDGSTDQSPSILAAYAEGDDRIVLVPNQTNLGLIASLNRGITFARGRYLARMDADDISAPERFAEQVAFLDQHPTIGLVGTAYHRLYEDGRTSTHWPPTDDTEIRWRLLFGCIWPHPAMMWRQSLFEPTEEIYHQFQYVEDYELWVRMLKRTSATTLAKPLVTIRTHRVGGISASNRELQERQILAISTRAIQEQLQQPVSPSDLSALHRAYHNQLLGGADLRSVNLFLTLLDVFQSDTRTNPRVVDRIKRRWIKRVTARLWSEQNLARATLKLLWILLKADLVAVTSVALLHNPKQFILGLTRHINRTKAFQAD